MESVLGLEHVGNSMCGYLRVELPTQRPGVGPATGIHTVSLQKEPASLELREEGFYFLWKGENPKLRVQLKC